jgi:peptidyl-prolyl cis-trans isomerase-like 4
MALLLETTLGDLVIDLDIEGSPELSRNVLKLSQARYYTNCLIFSVLRNRFCLTGDPSGDGTGGACIFGLIDSVSDERSSAIEKNPKRFLKSKGRELSNAECQERGRVVATELNGTPDTIGSQFLITLAEGPDCALDGYRMAIESHRDPSDSTGGPPKYFSLGVVSEDESNVLDQIHDAYCDAQGRPYADIRIIRALVLHDPFDDPPGMEKLLQKRGVLFAEDNETVTASPDCERPPEERVEMRIPADQIEPEEDELDDKAARERDERIKQKEDKSRAVVLEMLGDLPSAEIKAPENVLFICKLNPVTDDEDLELIFSRFDPNVKVDIIRDADTGASLQYAFAEFSNKDQAVEAYFKMNNALIDDRRIKVDFSQSVAKMWDKYAQRMRGSAAGGRRDTQGRGRPEHGEGRRRRGLYQSHQQQLQRPEVTSGGELRKRWEPPRQAQHTGKRQGRSPSQKRNRSTRHDSAGQYRDDRSHYSERHDSRPRSPERREHTRHHRDQRRRSRSESSTEDLTSSRDRKRRRDHHSKRRDRHGRRHDEERRRRRKHGSDERRDQKHRKHRRRSLSRSRSSSRSLSR